MADKLKVTVLGCGNSTGVPAIGNLWDACDPNEPKNRRGRSSIVIEKCGKTIVIDTGPDFREQINRENIGHIDAVLYTHQHSDHVNGIDELRVVRFRSKRNYIPCYGNAATFGDLSTRFHYLFDGGNHALYPPIIDFNILGEAHFGKAQDIAGLEIIPFEQDHGTCTSLGYRIDDFAYSVDMYRLDQRAVSALKGIKTWVVDAAAYNQESNPVHANLRTIYELNKEIGAKQVYLTSMSLAMDYQTLLSELPPGYTPAYDGLVIEMDD